MIKANELRIGNYVERHNKVTGVKDVVQVDGCTPLLAFEGMTTLKFNPIPFSEEWLLKFGFKNIDSTYTIDNDRFEFSFMFYDAWNLYYKEKKGFGCDEINLTGFWNIHQLQNLYFALTGTELELKVDALQ